MKDPNKVTLMGRLTRDPEFKTLPSGTSVAEFSLAVNSPTKKGDQWEDYANFFDCTAFGRTADVITDYCRKGQRLLVFGSLKQDRWENDGVNRSKVKIMIDGITLIERRDDSTGGGGGGGRQPQSSQSDHEDHGFDPPSYDDEEVPF